MEKQSRFKTIACTFIGLCISFLFSKYGGDIVSFVTSPNESLAEVYKCELYYYGYGGIYDEAATLILNKDGTAEFTEFPSSSSYVLNWNMTSRNSFALRCEYTDPAADIYTYI